MLTKVLRIGIVRDGKIVAEHVFREREDIRLGPDQLLGCPDMSRPELLKGHILFKHEGESYVLMLTRDMTFSGIPPKGTADAPFALPLATDSRGKVIVGDTSYLFMFVTRFRKQ